jgi:hypothetical protein
MLKMRILQSIVFFLFGLSVFAQEKTVDFDAVDSLYREDQFYFSLTYNIIQNLPTNVTSTKFSPGLSFGFLRDMPINKNRNVAIALGIGFSTNVYENNLYIYDINNGNLGIQRMYEPILDDTYYDKNKFSLSYIEIPLEIRWRTSTADSHKFWRIYSGFKLGYLVSDRYFFSNDVSTNIIKKNTDLNKFQYGCYLSAGWNSINVYAYYSLNPIFKSGTIAGNSIDINTLNLGFMFYIL